MDELDQEIADLLACTLNNIQELDANAAAKIIGEQVHEKAFHPFFREETVRTFTDILRKHRKAQTNGIPAEAFTLKYALGGLGKNDAYDARFNFSVFHNEQLIASLGFDPQPSTVAISQIQGRGRRAGALAGYHWQDALIEQTQTWGFDANIPQVTIIGAANNFWVHAQGHLPLERAITQYDIPATRLGASKMGNGDYLLPTRQVA